MNNPDIIYFDNNYADIIIIIFLIKSFCHIQGRCQVQGCSNPDLLRNSHLLS